MIWKYISELWKQQLIYWTPKETPTTLISNKFSFPSKISLNFNTSFDTNSRLNDGIQQFKTLNEDGLIMGKTFRMFKENYWKLKDGSCSRSVYCFSLICGHKKNNKQYIRTCYWCEMTDVWNTISDLSHLSPLWTWWIRRGYCSPIASQTVIVMEETHRLSAIRL